MDCPIIRKLQKEYTEATRGYFAAIRALTDFLTGSESNQGSFSQVYKRASETREYCTRTVRAIAKHRAEHHCD